MSFEDLRKEYPVFSYNGYSYSLDQHNLTIQFDFSIGDSIRFTPTMELRAGRYAQYPSDLKELEGIIFHIGMIELISYWKCTCSPTLLIRPYRLNEEEQLWWRKLYWYGLGEFFYQNHIDTNHEKFLTFAFDEEAPMADALPYPHVAESDRTIVPIGGGKDSVVTLEELRVKKEVVPFIINPRGATLACAEKAGFPNLEDILILKREISPRLLELNKEGFLNGHTPFSAMLAFYSVLISAVTGIRDVALSNESSANEPTVPGTSINHQYSKSLEFEEDFRYYVDQYMNSCNHYYSYLWPLTELQIAERFAKYPQYFHVFKSCNAGSKEDKWCGRCAKCLFAYIILSPFIDDQTMIEIFGDDLLNNQELAPILDQLAGMAYVKPFDCVGTVKEVNEALKRILESRKDKALVKHYLNKQLELLDNNMLEEYYNMAP